MLEKGFKCSPQEYVTSNILCLFRTMDKDIDDKFLKWFKDNEITEKFNIPWTKYNSNGYIKLETLNYTNKWILLIYY